MSTTGVLGVDGARSLVRRFCIVGASLGVGVLLASCGTGGNAPAGTTTPDTSAGAPSSEELAGCVLSQTYDNGEIERAEVYRPTAEQILNVTKAPVEWSGQASFVVAYGDFRSDVDQEGSDDRVSAIWLVIPDAAFPGTANVSVCDDSVTGGEWATVPDLSSLGSSVPVPESAWPSPPPTGTE